MQIIRSIKGDDTKKFINIVNKHVIEIYEFNLPPSYIRDGDYNDTRFFLADDCLGMLLEGMCEDIFFDFVKNIPDENLRNIILNYYDLRMHVNGDLPETDEATIAILLAELTKTNISDIVTIVNYMETNMERILAIAYKKILEVVILPEVRKNNSFLNGMDANIFEAKCKKYENKYKSTYQWQKEEKKIQMYDMIFNYLQYEARQNKYLEKRRAVIKNTLKISIFADGANIIMSYIARDNMKMNNY